MRKPTSDGLFRIQPITKINNLLLEKFWRLMEKPIKANAMLEDFNKQTPEPWENQNKLKEEYK